MRSRLGRAARAALMGSLAGAAILIPLAQAQARGPYRVYTETTAIVRGCYTAWTFWRTTASGLWIANNQSERMSSLVVSASGRQLAYSSGVDDAPGDQIKLLDIPRGGGRASVTTLSGQPDDYGLRPLAISPRGRYVLAQAAGGFPPAARYYLFANGRRVRTLTPDPSFYIQRAAWSPSGALVVANGDEPRRRLALMTLSGKLSALRLRADDTSGLAWTGDGRRLLLTIDNDLVSVRPDGHDLRTLARNAHFAAASPDGAQLAFLRLGVMAPKGWAVVTSDANGRHQLRYTSLPPTYDLESLAWALPTRLPSDFGPPITGGGNCS